MTDTTTAAPAAGTPNPSADPTTSLSSTDGGTGTGTGSGTPAAGGDTAKGGKGAAPAGTATGAATGGDSPFWEAFTDAKLKESPVILRHKTVEDLARSLTAAESRLGVPADQLIRVPTKDEDYAEVWKKLGAPDSPEGYKIGLPDKATPEDKALAERFGKAMFEAGPFPPTVVKAAIDFINGETLAADAELETAQAARQAEGEALLKKELGAAYDPDMKAVGKLLADLGGKELQDELAASGAGNNPRLMLALQKIVDRLGEPQGLDGGGRGTGAGAPMTPGQAKAARITLENDPIKGPALRDKGHAMHQSVVEERNRLFAFEAGRTTG